MGMNTAPSLMPAIIPPEIADLERRVRALASDFSGDALRIIAELEQKIRGAKMGDHFNRGVRLEQMEAKISEEGGAGSPFFTLCSSLVAEEGEAGVKKFELLQMLCAIRRQIADATSGLANLVREFEVSQGLTRRPESEE